MELTDRCLKLFEKKNRFLFIGKKCTSCNINNENDWLNNFSEAVDLVRKGQFKSIINLSNVSTKEVSVLSQAIKNNERIDSININTGKGNNSIILIDSKIISSEYELYLSMNQVEIEVASRLIKVMGKGAN